MTHSHTKHRHPGGRRLEMMRRRLDLTDEQVATLRERMAEHRRQGFAIVREVLTEEQRARFDAHVERRRQRFEGRGRGRRHGHGHGHGRWLDEEASRTDGDVAPPAGDQGPS